MLQSGWAHAPWLLILGARGPQLLSLRATTAGARVPGARALNGRGHRSEGPAHRSKERPWLDAAGGSLRTAARTQRSQQ